MLPEDSFVDRELWDIQQKLEHAAAFQGRLPPCITERKPDCTYCFVGSGLICQIKNEPDYHSYLRHLRDRYLIDQQKRRVRIDILIDILRKHKLAIHWEHLSLLAMRADPYVFSSPQIVRGLVFLNHDIFVVNSDGVCDLTEHIKKFGWESSNINCKGM